MPLRTVPPAEPESSPARPATDISTVVRRRVPATPDPREAPNAIGRRTLRALIVLGAARIDADRIETHRLSVHRELSLSRPLL